LQWKWYNLGGQGGKIGTGGCPTIPQSKHFSEAQDFSPTRKILEKDNIVSKKQLSDSPTASNF